MLGKSVIGESHLLWGKEEWVKEGLSEEVKQTEIWKMSRNEEGRERREEWTRQRKQHDTVCKGGRKQIKEEALKDGQCDWSSTSKAPVPTR